MHSTDADTHQHVSCWECGFVLFMLGLKPFVPNVNYQGTQCCTCGRDLLGVQLQNPDWLLITATERSN